MHALPVPKERCFGACAILIVGVVCGMCCIPGSWWGSAVGLVLVSTEGEDVLCSMCSAQHESQQQQQKRHRAGRCQRALACLAAVLHCAGLCACRLIRKKGCFGTLCLHAVHTSVLRMSVWELCAWVSCCVGQCGSVLTMWSQLSNSMRRTCEHSPAAAR